ncbi:plant virulence effector HPE1-like domain-containing protein [Rhizobium calliandrae]|uniref:Plant virulence effector HPE1-like domain-containing protein n=1 Tax=Rhizobium calliandrae TaxID=1312182 RepID=A0ABT7KNT4_9HYPH|nr:plant virulence effector HPE1-like domain-containing protein [Rhizobium calliandrae]MDL2410286.1 plant virulence effector HPE1-like domain-containing protein [Rhizobium calliandrae]
MRPFFLTLAFALAGSSAMASSIQPIDSRTETGAGSIIDKVCTDCPALKPQMVKKDYVVPELTPGTQSIIVRDIDGQRKVVRTEAWMGGSPVVFISKPTPEALAAADAPADGIDMTAKTAALPESAKTKPPLPLDLSGFELRQ